LLPCHDAKFMNLNRRYITESEVAGTTKIIKPEIKP
jgi:hypothetical protein